MIVSGRLGKPIFIAGHVRWYRPPEYYATSKWRGSWALDGGGALMNQAIHTVDVLQWLFGPVARVAGRTGTLLHAIKTEDTAGAVLEFESGALGIIEATTSSYPGYARRVDVERIGRDADPRQRQAGRRRTCAVPNRLRPRRRAAAGERGVSDCQRQRAASADLRRLHQRDSHQPHTRLRRPRGVARAWRLSKRSTGRPRAERSSGLPPSLKLRRDRQSDATLPHEQHLPIRRQRPEVVRDDGFEARRRSRGAPSSPE